MVSFFEKKSKQFLKMDKLESIWSKGIFSKKETFSYLTKLEGEKFTNGSPPSC